jgi:hypothetical protein
LYIKIQEKISLLEFIAVIVSLELEIKII